MFIKIIVRECTINIVKSSLLDLLQFTWVALHESMPLVVLLFDINCSCASAKPFPLPLPTIGVEDRGAGVTTALPSLEKFAKISHNRAENQHSLCLRLDGCHNFRVYIFNGL